MMSNYRYTDCVYYPLATKNTLGITYFEPFRYKTVNVLNHFCIPNGADYVDENTYESFK